MRTMDDKLKPANQLSASRDKKERERRITRFLNDPEFIKDVSRVKASLASGSSLDEARGLIKCSPIKWKTIEDCLGRLSVNPHKLFLEFSSVQKHRYTQATNILQKARNESDTDLEIKALMILLKIDEARINLAEKLGLLNLSTDPESGGMGYKDSELEEKLAELDRTIELQIRASKQDIKALSIGIQSDIDVATKEDAMGSDALDTSNTPRSE